MLTLLLVVTLLGIALAVPAVIHFLGKHRYSVHFGRRGKDFDLHIVPAEQSSLRSPERLNLPPPKS